MPLDRVCRVYRLQDLVGGPVQDLNQVRYE